MKVDDKTAAKCGMTVEHLTSLVAMKRLCGKTTPQIERDIMRIAFLMDGKEVFTRSKELN